MTKHSPFKYFKASPEIIRLAVMLYVRFPLSLRNVEGLLHELRLTSRSNFKLNRAAALAEWRQLLAG
jgi:transposase-like protein